VLYLSDVEDGGETFFPQAKEWFDRDHEEYVQRNTCPTTGSNGEGSCLYPSLTPTRGKIAYPKNFTVAEVSLFFSSLVLIFLLAPLSLSGAARHHKLS
jgi:hypothetical protein